MKFDPEPFVRRIRKDNAVEKEKIRERQEEAILEAERLAKTIMAADPEVRRVFLFGSLAEGMPRNPHFDIDLAMDGGDIHKAMDLSEDSPFAVDIVELAGLPEHIRKRVLEKGRELPRQRDVY